MRAALPHGRVLMPVFIFSLGVHAGSPHWAASEQERLEDGPIDSHLLLCTLVFRLPSAFRVRDRGAVRLGLLRGGAPSRRDFRVPLRLGLLRGGLPTRDWLGLADIEWASRLR